MVEEVLSEEAEPRHLSQLQTAIDNLQNARSVHAPLHVSPSIYLPQSHWVLPEWVVRTTL